jgi:hypothetical protein
MKGNAPCRRHEILPHSVLTLEKSYLAAFTFRSIPAGRPTETMPCPAGNSKLG